MRHYYKVEEYLDDKECFDVTDEDGEHLMMIFEFKDFPNHIDTSNLVGKKVSVAFTQPYISFGVSAKLEG